MKTPFLTAVVGLLAAAGLVGGQSPEAPPPPSPGPVKLPPPPPAGNPSCPAPPQPYVESSFVTADVEILLWWLKQEPIGRGGGFFTSDPTLRAGGTPRDTGRDPTSREPVTGGRFTVGYWIDDYDLILSRERRLALAGVEATGFFLGERSVEFLSGPAPALFRPFFNLNAGVASAFVVAFPGLAAGEISGSAQSQLWGGEVNAWCNVCGTPPGQVLRADLMAGVRYLQLDGSLQINQNTLFGPNLAAFPAFLPFAGSRLEAFDSFGVENQYFGGQIGARIRFLLAEYAELSTTVKYGFGTTHQRLDINGGQLLTAPGGAQTQSVGGLLALPSNIGTRSRDRFTQVPEINVKAAVNVSRHLSLYFGYNFLYFSRVIRAADQIDRDVDVTQLPNFPGAAGATPTGLGRPTALFRESGLVVQGLNFGLQVTW